MQLRRHCRRAQKSALPVIGFLSGRAPEGSAHLIEAYRRALKEGTFIEGQNVAIEFRWRAATTNAWSRDVTADIADELRRRYVEFDEVPASIVKFLETASRH